MNEAPSTRNVALLEQVMQHIEDHPEQHDQNEWATQTDCGTAACFAGWAAIFTFGESIVSNGGFTCPRPYDHMRMSAVAARLLGITDDEADTLFTAWNSREMLHLMVKDLVSGAELLPSPEDYEAIA